MSFTVNAYFSQALFHRTLQHIFKSSVHFFCIKMTAGVTTSYEFSRQKWKQGLSILRGFRFYS